MSGRVIVFVKRPEGERELVRFAVPSSGFRYDFTLDGSVGPTSEHASPKGVRSCLNALAERAGLTRHEAFDWAAGDAGARCALLEFTIPGLATLPSSLTGYGSNLEWLTFPEAVRRLTDHDDRRYLQLAVQYISVGGRVDDSVLASDYDRKLLDAIARKLDPRLNGDDGKES